MLIVSHTSSFVAGLYHPFLSTHLISALDCLLAHSFLKPDFDSAVENSPFSVRIDFAESWVLMRRKNHRPEPALASIGNVFGINKQADFAVSFFAENP